MVSNHLSYLDVPVYYSTQPQVFLSKAEVRNWPLIGWLTWCAGTLYIRRDRRTEVGKVREQFEEVLAQGFVITLFPEGTSSDGSSVLPFHSSLLEPAVGEDRVITPAWIKYEMSEGDPAQDVCYWGDMVFGPHFLKMLGKGRITATIVFGEPISGAGLNRKDLARILKEKVEMLAGRHGRM